MKRGKKFFVICLILSLLVATTSFTPMVHAAENNLATRLAGKLLLQVERDGRIWYVDTQDQNRYQITIPNALSIFRKLSLGISNKDLAKIPIANSGTDGDVSLQKRVAGRMLLQVEDAGRIWYVNPETLERHEVTQANLLELFRSLSLGISNDNLFALHKGALASEQLPTFKSCTELAQAVQNDARQTFVKELRMFDQEVTFDANLGAPSIPTAAPEANTATTQADDRDYSTTNIQEKGVDEPDIVKSDGDYIYYVHNGVLSIAKAWPDIEAEIITTIDLEDIRITEIFINGDSLMVFGEKDNFYYANDALVRRIAPWPQFRPVTFVRIYDIANRAQPKHKRTLEFHGNYHTARLIGDHAYIVMNSYLDFPIAYAMEGSTEPLPEENEIVPYFQDSAKNENEPQPLIGCSSIRYIPPVQYSQFITVVTLPINDYTAAINKEVILGSSENVYVSPENIFITQTNYKHFAVPIPLVDTAADEAIQAPDEDEVTNNTKIYKIGLNEDEIVYYGQGEVPGRIINQFSLSEYQKHLRIATTTDNFNGQTANHVYVLDDDLEIVGAIKDIAPGERIFSTQFMGDKGYMVTFKNIDPFFTMDLSDPKNPQLIGKLKIPGFSDYLQAYDENHIIGIGKDAIEDKDRDFAWFQGLKIALFDVTDFNNPKELHRVIIGDRGSDSPVLRDHKALLFNKDKQLFALPVLLAELTDEQKNDPDLADRAYGDYTFQGLYVYKLNPETGFTLIGRISHIDDPDMYLKSGFYFRGNEQINRSLYIEDSLYSLSNDRIEIHDMSNNLVEIKSLPLPQQEVEKIDAMISEPVF